MASNTIIGEHMLKAMACCEPVATRASEVMRFVRIKADQDGMTFEATDCEMFVRYRVPGQFEQLDCVVPVSKWTAVVRANDKAGAFATVVDKDRMKISVGRAKYTIPAPSGTAWREEPSAVGGYAAQIEVKDFLRALRRVAPAMGSSEQCIKPPIGAGVFVATTKGQSMKLVAPSNHRIALEEIKSTYSPEHAGQFWGIVPRQAVDYLLKIEKNLEGTGCLRTNFNNFLFETHSHQVIGSLAAYQMNADGKKKIPDMKSMLDHSNRKWSAKMTRDTLIQLIAAGGVFSEVSDSAGKSHSVLNLHFDKGKVVFQSQEDNVQMSEAEAECESTGTVTIKINGDYVKDVARLLDKGEQFEFALAENPNLLFVVSGSFIHSIALLKVPVVQS